MGVSSLFTRWLKCTFHSRNDLSDKRYHCQSHKFVLPRYVSGSTRMNDLNLWATAYRQILQNHANPAEMRFWLDALDWDKLEPMASGKVHIFLSAPNVFYANFITDKFKTEIEAATSQILGKSCEVSIAVMDAKPVDEVASAAITNRNQTTIPPVSSPLSPPSLMDTTPAMQQSVAASPSPG